VGGAFAPTAHNVASPLAYSRKHPARAIELYRHMQRAGELHHPSGDHPLLHRVELDQGGARLRCPSVRSHIGSALIEAYGRCGFVAGAQRVFDQVRDRDVVVWSSLVSAYAFHGHAEVAMSLFRHMQEQDNVRPDGIMFLSLLAACAHSGRADDALRYFDVLTKRYEVEACGDHYSCLVDVLGRAGRLHQAYELIRTMPFKVTAKAWGALLAACRKYGEVRLA
jgi:pentatricopeptide repeat protein